MRKELEEHTKIAEQKIRDALQEFHDSTGLTPMSLEFTMIDIRTFSQILSGTRSAAVGQCDLHAQL